MNRFLIVLLLGFINCNCNKNIDLPKDLDEAISYFDNNWTTQEKEAFVKDSLKNAHFSTGSWIRNNWIHGQRDTFLVKYFNNMGIYHPDDISFIILTSLYRKLTNKPIDLNKQVEFYKAYWKPIFDCEKQQKKKALNNYNRFKIGDNITILMLVDTSDGQRNAVFYDCPNVEWTFNPKIDLEINGIVKEKFFINDTSNVFFKVLITKLNYPNTTILSDTININETNDFSLEGLTIK